MTSKKHLCLLAKGSGRYGTRKNATNEDRLPKNLAQDRFAVKRLELDPNQEGRCMTPYVYIYI